MVIYSENKMFFENDEKEYINKMNFDEEAFKDSYIRKVNVSVNDISFYYSMVPTTMIKNINRFGFIDYEKLKNTKEEVLYVKLRDFDKKLKKKKLSEEELAIVKYNTKTIKKYLSKKEEYDNYYESFFPNNNHKVLQLKED